MILLRGVGVNADRFPEAAVVLDLHGRDASRQQVFATLSPRVIRGDEAHEAGESLFPGKPF